MAGWEYLDLHWDGGESAEIVVRRDSVEVLADWLQSALRCEVRVDKEKRIIGIRVRFKDRFEVLDALGKSGWEMVGFDRSGYSSYYFKRSRDG